jgi:hypothetical protein
MGGGGDGDNMGGDGDDDNMRGGGDGDNKHNLYIDEFSL